MTDTNEVLTQAVGQLNRNVVALTNMLAKDYPKSSEIERRYQSKLDARKHLTRMTFLALLVVVSCYAMSTGAYAVCFVGDENPGFCRVLPGYQDRIDRRDEINENERRINERLRRIEDKLK